MDLFSGALGVGGAFLQNDFNRTNADHAMDRSDSMAREQMAFQERMSSSAYQRATTDMKKAGLNPMLAFQQGGASSPGGAMGQSHKAESVDPIGRGLSSAVDVKRLQNETKAQGSQQALNDAMASKALADAQNAGASTKQTEVQTQAVKSQLEAIAARAKADAATAKYDYKAATYDAVAKRVNRESNSAANVKELFSFPKFKGPPAAPKRKPNPDRSGVLTHEEREMYVPPQFRNPGW